MAVRVVHLFEVVDVGHDEAERLPLPHCSIDLLGEAVIEGSAVQTTRQLVG